MIGLVVLTESGCLLPSMPSDASFDSTSGISFTCDLNDNIAAPWPSSMQAPSSSCNKCMLSTCCAEHTLLFNNAVYMHIDFWFSLKCYYLVHYSARLIIMKLKTEALCCIPLDYFTPFMLKLCLMMPECMILL